MQLRDMDGTWKSMVPTKLKTGENNWDNVDRLWYCASHNELGFGVTEAVWSLLRDNIPPAKPNGPVSMTPVGDEFTTYTTKTEWPAQTGISNPYDARFYYQTHLVYYFRRRIDQSTLEETLRIIDNTGGASTGATIHQIDWAAYWQTTLGGTLAAAQEAAKGVYYAVIRQSNISGIMGPSSDPSGWVGVHFNVANM